MKKKTKHPEARNSRSIAELVRYAWMAFGVTSAIVAAACSGVPTPATDADAISIKQPSGQCLALSGGGIRSAATALGVLQALQDRHELYDYDYVSAVSGGGWPVYGLIYQLAHENRKIADLLSEHGGYVQYVESHSSEFVQLVPDAVSAGIFAPLNTVAYRVGISPETAGHNTYRHEIHKAFAGAGDYGLHLGLSLDSLAQNPVFIRRTAAFPVPIFGSSAKFELTPPLEGHKYTADDYFELSPGYSGSTKYGFWSRIGDFRFELIDAVADAASAADSPVHDAHTKNIPDFLKVMTLGLGSYVVLHKSIYLSDGGFVENLGLLPLLTKTCKNVLALDAEWDTSDTVGAWETFRTRLTENSGTRWVIPDLTPVSPRETGSPKDAWHVRTHIYSAELHNAEGKSIHVTIMKLGISVDHLSEYPKEVREFADIDWKAPSWSKANLHCVTPGGPLTENCPFPMQATVHQDYAAREFEAYRLMGKYLVNLVVKR